MYLFLNIHMLITRYIKYHYKILFYNAKLITIIFFMFTIVFSNSNISYSNNSVSEIIVPAGNYWMYTGLKDSDRIRVYIDQFSIDKFPVSVSDYAACISMKKCSEEPIRRFIDKNKFTNYPKDFDKALERSFDDQLPMILVSYQEAQTYCATQGKRLPTVSEWRKAMRGQDGTARDLLPAETSVSSWVNEEERWLQRIYFKVQDAISLGPYGVHYIPLRWWSEMSQDYYHSAYNSSKLIRHNPLCTEAIHKALPMLKDSYVLSIRGLSASSVAEGGSIYIVEIVQEFNDIGFRCVRSKLMEPEDFNK